MVGKAVEPRGFGRMLRAQGRPEKCPSTHRDKNLPPGHGIYMSMPITGTEVG